jgi:hypothetical protein
MAGEGDQATGNAAVIGPVYLRWRPVSGGAAPETERFADLDAALDAVEARWETLQHAAPQVLDGRRVLLASTEELKQMMEAEEE